MRLLIYVLAILILSSLQFASRPAQAHSQSYGYIDLNLSGATAEGRFEAAVRDINRLLHLDADRDGRITWGEVRQHESEITRAVLKTITLTAASGPCTLISAPVLTDSHGGETYIVMPFTSTCGTSEALTLGYSFLDGLDASHRGLATLHGQQGEVRNFVVPAGEGGIALGSQGRSLPREMASFVAHGFHHILIGYDHILFVLTLLIGTAVQQRRRPVWETFVETAKVVTAFTLSHSLTLGLAATGLLAVPVAMAESLIAATIAIAAVNNIWPLLTSRLWLVALGFGLIHGVGFANVLSGLGLPQDNLLLALLSFNIGVEAGQLTVVAVALPLIAMAARLPLSRLVVPTANVAIIALALMWLSDRSLGTSLMPF